MKNIIQSKIFFFILGLIVAGGVTVLADNIGAGDVTYKETTVEEAIDDLYTKATTYKNLTQTTTATSSDLLYGKTAYNTNGELLTGTIATDCVRGSQIYTTTGTKTIFNFKPKHFLIYAQMRNSGQKIAFYYNENLSSTSYMLFRYGSEASEDRVFNSSNTNFNMYNDSMDIIITDNWKNQTIYYMACR